MTSLNLGGPPITSAAKQVAHLSYVDTVKAQALTQAQVDSRIATNLTGYVTKAYVDQQDATLATADYVNQRDALKVPLTQRGQPNGVATLVSSLVPAAQLPTVVQRNPRGPASPSGYNTGSVSTSGTEVTLYTMNITDPGYSYRLMIWGYSEASASDGTTTGLVYARQNGTAGAILAVGQTKMGADFGDVVWGPTLNGSVLTGASTIYIRGLRQQGSGTIAFSNFNPNCAAIIVPA